MIAFRIGDAYLEMSPDTTVTMTINSPIYTGGDPTNIEGTYSFPFTVDLTEKNKALLNHPHRVDNIARLSKISRVLFYGDGLPLFVGDLYVESATAKTAKCSFIYNPLSEIKDRKVAELIDQTITDEDMPTYAKSTALEPDNKNVVFFPVVNKEWLPDGVGPELILDAYLWKRQNVYNVQAQKFANKDYFRGITPFLKVEYIITSIIAATGFAYVDRFFDREDDTDGELRNLCSYNNYSISLEDGSWSSTISLQDHAPDQEANETLKQFCSLFFLGIFDNPFDRTISLIPLRDVLTAPEVADWTSRVVPDYAIEDNDIITPSRYRYIVDTNDGLTGKYVDPDVDIVDVVGIDSDAVPSSQDNLRHYYLTHQNMVVWRVGNLFRYYKYFMEIESAVGDSTYDIQLAPMYMLTTFHEIENDDSAYLPEIAIRGRWGDYREDAELEGPISAMRMVFYRGMHQNADGKLYPFASNHNRNYNGEKVGQYSLLLNGEDGIIQKWGTEVVRYMNNRRTIKRTINLNIKDILNFRKEYKYRIENMNYFVSQMVVQFRMDRPVNSVACTLQSVTI